MSQQELLPPLGGFTSEQIAWLDRRYMQHPSAEPTKNTVTSKLEIRRFICRTIDLIKTEYKESHISLDDLRGYLARRMDLQPGDKMPGYPSNPTSRLTVFDKNVYEALRDWPLDESPFITISSKGSKRVVYQLKP